MCSSMSCTPVPCLALHQHGARGVQADDGFDLLANPLRFGGRQIDLVDHRNNFQVVVQRQVGVGQRLRLHTLRGVHHQQRALAGLQAARNLVGEIHVARRIDQIELILVAVVGAVVQADRVRLDGDAALALQVHRVQHLFHHFARRKRAGRFQQPVRQRGLAVVDVRNDREIADEFAVHEGWGTHPIISYARVALAVFAAGAFCARTIMRRPSWVRASANRA